MKRKHLPAIVLIFLVLLAGCVPAPRRGDGRLAVTVSWAAKPAWRSVADIATVTATLTRGSLVVTSSLTVNQAAGTATGEIGGLYAGDWTLKIEAAMADATVIYAGQTTVTVVSGETRTVTMTLQPAPGKLDITLDVLPLINQGYAVTKGTVYIYEDPADGSSTSREMSLEGTNLHAVVNLGPKTYDARVAVPNISDDIYTSEFFQFDILSGRTTAIVLQADGGVAVEVSIDDAPGRVTGLTAVPSADRTQVDLAWTPVPGATGYRVYRTNNEGRFMELAVLEGGSRANYTDATFAAAKPYAGAIRYAVAALAGEIEGLRSEPAAVAAG